MQNEYGIGQKLIWIQVEEETGKKVTNIVTVMGVRSYPQSAYYSIRIDTTGEVAMAWHDELKRYREV